MVIIYLAHPHFNRLSAYLHVIWLYNQLAKKLVTLLAISLAYETSEGKKQRTCKIYPSTSVAMTQYHLLLNQAAYS